MILSSTEFECSMAEHTLSGENNCKRLKEKKMKEYLYESGSPGLVVKGGGS